MFQKILIANRGEIAVRIARACRELGIPSAAVYSDIDQQALHVRMADEALAIGPALASESYLNIPRLVQAARDSGADAIHPGYGFLSENADFAAAVEQAGLTFIGPKAESIRAMGDKSQARTRMQASGVPVIPGYQGLDTPQELARAAQEIGYPVLVKAAAGGGGKGMRVVWEPQALEQAAQTARREARRSFGDERLILETFIPNARHIEFQVLADQYGKVLHLFERECSIQRRHQKVIEETPSPYITPELREAMGQAAIAAARAVDYQNAGTVEFIVDPTRQTFYFLEMNTRLQVEHPITENVTGLDLVQWQIRVADGEPLPFEQHELVQRGHSIECRLYAEDPANNFMPATGPLLRFIEPRGPGVRVDSGFTSGDEITIHYDPLIAKVIVFAADRQAAIRKMQSTLRETVLLGVTTNWQFLQDILSDWDFQRGNIYTTWVEEHFGDWQPPQCELPPEVLIAAALTQFQPAPGSQAPDTHHDPYSPWRAGNQFRLGEGASDL
jgi:3-methylcrotonyl-CoA carboxylase alpha subunit